MGRSSATGRFAFWTGVALLAALALGHAARAEKTALPEVDLILVLAVDVSESINRQEAWLQRLGYAEALTDPLVVSAIEAGRKGRIAVTYLEWAGPGEQRQVVGWTPIDGMESARIMSEALLDEPISGGYWTSLSSALRKASALIATAPFVSKRHVIDLSSDGLNNSGDPLAPERKRVLAQGITINGLPVMAKRKNFTWPPQPNLNRYYNDCVIGGPGAFSVLVENNEDFATAVRRKLIREIVSVPALRPRLIPAAGTEDAIKPLCREEPGNLDSGADADKS